MHTQYHSHHQQVVDLHQQKIHHHGSDGSSGERALVNSSCHAPLISIDSSRCIAELTPIGHQTHSCKHGEVCTYCAAGWRGELFQILNLAGPCARELCVLALVVTRRSSHAVEQQQPWPHRFGMCKYKYSSKVDKYKTFHDWANWPSWIWYFVICCCCCCFGRANLMLVCYWLNQLWEKLSTQSRTEQRER